tara:strand:- start:372 stop:1334 length:963 start_codon:yes stop_codon:yes gene_type:complete
MSNARNLANLLGTKTKVKDVDVDGTELILDADADTSITADTDDQIDFKTGGSDRVTIDSSGNLFVAKTTVATATAGVALRSNGEVRGTVDGGLSARFSRLSDDGSIIGFEKDGSSVGSIGSVASGANLFMSASSGVGLGIGGDNLYPVNGSGASTDNSLDLGDASARFNDLYLGGGLYVGGTGSANYLDDYEEGTWTPTLGGGSSGSFGLQVESATYTKVGRLVTVIGSINTTSESSPQGYLTVGGLPFTPSSGHVGRSPMLFYMDGMETNNTADVIGLTLGSDNTARAYLGDSNTPQSDLAQAMDASTYILVTITYNTS